MENAAIFFDKDGTLVKNVPYNVRPELIELNDGAARAVQKLKQAGFRLFVVSNQSGVGRGYFLESDLTAVWEKINELCDVKFDGFYYCPHNPEDGCDCRKPNPGMLVRAASENRINLEKSWVVGDILNDIEAGRRAGCKTILLDVGNEPELILKERRQPDFTVKNLLEAAEIILRDLQNKS